MLKLPRQAEFAEHVFCLDLRLVIVFVTKDGKAEYHFINEPFSEAIVPTTATCCLFRSALPDFLHMSSMTMSITEIVEMIKTGNVLYRGDFYQIDYLKVYPKEWYPGQPKTVSVKKADFIKLLSKEPIKTENNKELERTLAILN